MKLTARERADRREAFRRMSAAQKADYIFSYYKLPIVLTLLFAYVLCYGLYRHFSRKEALLYVACANVVVSEDTADALSEGFVRYSGKDVRKCEVSLYKNLYLSDNPTLANHQYAYASRLKLLAAIDAEQVDVILMNREAYDLLSGKGYLLELSAFLKNNPNLLRRLQSGLTENQALSADSRTSPLSEEAERYNAIGAYQTNAIDVSRFPIFQNADFADSVFLGVIPNSPRTASAQEYIAYLESGC